MFRCNSLLFRFPINATSLICLHHFNRYVMFDIEVFKYCKYGGVWYPNLFELGNDSCKYSYRWFSCSTKNCYVENFSQQCHQVEVGRPWQCHTYTHNTTLYFDTRNGGRLSCGGQMDSWVIKLIDSSSLYSMAKL